MNEQPKFKESNLSNGTYRFVFINDEMDLTEIQTLIVSTFFDFMDQFIIPYGVELCFELFDVFTQMPKINKNYQAYLLKIENPKLSFKPIRSNTQVTPISKIDKETVMQFILEQNEKAKGKDLLMGLSRLSFQTGLFRLPTKIDKKRFYLEKENQVQTAYEYECTSVDWFESPLKNTFMFPPIELDFNKDPYTKA